VPEQKSPQEEQEPLPQLTWQELTALGTILGAYAYVAGSAALLVPIARTYMRYDLSTAWYAVSLVPRNVVIGHAARLAASRMGPLILLAICSLLIFFLAQHFADKEASRTDSGWITRFLGSSLKHFSLVFPLMVGLVSTLIFTVIIVWSVVARVRLIPEYSWALVLNGLLIIVGLALWSHLIRDALRHKVDQRRLLVPRVSNWQRLMGATAVYLFVAYSGILVTAVLASPPLPQVEIYGTSSGEAAFGPLIAEGTLLAHTDGFWYVFVQQADNHRPEHEIALRAISDVTVAQVNVLSTASRK
jgi:hypothetical protein